jgi:single-strand DNA-binding protein
VAFESNYITFIGNLTDDPDLRFTPSGVAVCSFRVASNRRWTGKDGQQQEETTFLSANCWRDMAENIAESLNKGDRVIVIGRVRVRSYENRDGQTVWVTEIEADEVAPSLRWATTSVSRNAKGGASSNGNGNGHAQRSAPAPSGASVDELEENFSPAGAAGGDDGPMF